MSTILTVAAIIMVFFMLALATSGFIGARHRRRLDNSPVKATPIQGMDDN